MKKILLLLMVAAMAFSYHAVAAPDRQSDDSVQSLMSMLGIMSGDENGNLNLDDNVSRAEFAKMAVMASKYKNMVAYGTPTSPFLDVNYTHWAAPYIKTASVYKIVKGYPDSTFLPDGGVLVEEAATMALKLLGYTDDDFSIAWPYGQMGVAENIDLLDDVDCPMGTVMTRAQVRKLIYNLLTCNKKDSAEMYLTSLDYKYVEDVTLIATSTEFSGVGAGKVLTSAGTYTINEHFDTSSIGRYGDAVLKKNNELVLFFPSEQRAQEYNIYSVVGNKVALYKNGEISPIEIDTDISVYYKGQKSTLSAIIGSINLGDPITLFYDENGILDYATITDAKIDGPVTNSGSNWRAALSVGAGATIIKDGKASSSEKIEKFDVVYYSAALNTVWAYSKKVAGVYEQAQPNRETVTSIKVAGTSYNIETAAAMKKLSSNGEFALGDNVILLLGKDGDVADVISPDEGSKNVVYGYLVSTGNKEFVDENGNKITSPYVEIALPDGTVNTYKSRSTYENQRCSIVCLDFKDGIANVKKVNTSYNISGKFSYTSKTIGNQTFAENVKILDVGTTSPADTGIYASVFAQRLDGVTIYSGDVLYCERNAKNEISELILKDVTGDSYEYGVVVSADKDEKKYTAMVGSENRTINAGMVTYNVLSGQPAKFKYNGGALDSLVKLTKLNGPITDIDYAYISTSGAKHLLADNVVVYNATNSYSSGIYRVLPIDDIVSGDYRIEAYYDKSQAQGGRIRVILAFEK